VNALVSAVLLGAIFAALNGALALAVDVPALGRPGRALAALAAPARARWLLTLATLPALLTLVMMVPPVLDALSPDASGSLTLAVLCHRLHAHCDLTEGSAAETVVYVVGAVCLAAAVVRLGWRLLLPRVATAWAARAVLSPDAGARLALAVGRVEALTGTAVRTVVRPRVPGGAFVLGVRRPVVALDARLAEAATADELVAVLLHELEHFRAGDGIVNVLVEACRGISVWPRAGRRLLRRYFLEREILRDSAVVNRGGDPLALASVLVKAARATVPAGATMPALADASSPLSLRVRLLVAAAGRGSAPVPADGPDRWRWTLLLVLAASFGAAAFLARDALTFLHCAVEDLVHLIT
jgi:beta-lactamase regulating signal transducer with metallopeptidase domain